MFQKKRKFELTEHFISCFCYNIFLFSLIGIFILVTFTLFYKEEIYKYHPVYKIVKVEKVCVISADVSMPHNNKILHLKKLDKDIYLNRQDYEKELLELNNIIDEKEKYIKYRELQCKYYSVVKPKSIFDDFSKEDVLYLCKAVETEVYDKDFESKVNVACVILNRLDNGRFGDVIKEIVTNPSQFAYYRNAITEDTILAVMYAYEMDYDAQGALYFHSNEKTEEFHGQYLFTDKAGHHFYK